MNFSLNYYNTYGPAGKIYVRCVGELHQYKVEFHLYCAGELVQSKTAYGNELIAFLYTSPAEYKISAEIDAGQGEKIRLCSEKIQPVSVDLLPCPIVDIMPMKGHLELVADQQNILVVDFIKGGLKKLLNESSAAVPLFNQLRHAVTFTPRYDQDTINNIVKYSPELESLRYVYHVEPDISNHELLDLANELQRLDYVVYCDLLGSLDPQPPEPSEPEITPEPPVPANTPTPNFTHLQGYLDGGRGMHVRAVWSRGITGRGMRVLMWDSGLHPLHEDLTGVREGYSGYGTSHGTGVAGAIIARNNGFGVTGIAFDANLYAYRNVYNGLDNIARDARPGDVVTVSLGNVQNGVSVPIIYSRHVWNTMNAMVRSGVVVVIAAGNGGVDLRNFGFGDHGDNGVIIVASINPDTGRRSSFSNFNFRNLVHSWGENVTTTGYGNLFNPGNVNRLYRRYFTGTSAATPLVSGVLTLIQSYARTRYGTIFNNRQMLSILEATGNRDAVNQLIGVRPNAAAAIEYVDQMFREDSPPPPPLPNPYPQWQLNTLYEVGDRVVHMGVNYQCLIRHVSRVLGYAPHISPTLWQPLSTLSYPQWQLNTQYEVGNRVTHLNINYQCLLRHVSRVLGYAPNLSPTLWQRI